MRAPTAGHLLTAGPTGDVAGSGIRHVLFDADGVMQSMPGGWYAAMEPYVGERAQEFLHGIWQDEKPMLAGQGEYLPLLAARLTEFGVSASVEQVYRDVWQRIDPDGDSVAIVQALRANGYGVHLGTNQERHRAAHMRVALGYNALFDVSCYSCDLGVAKPEPGFFAEAARRIAAEPSSILFIDDSARNVEGARAAGLAAARWELAQGHDVQLALLGRHGVIADPRAGNPHLRDGGSLSARETLRRSTFQPGRDDGSAK